MSNSAFSVSLFAIKNVPFSAVYVEGSGTCRALGLDLSEEILCLFPLPSAVTGSLNTRRTFILFAGDSKKI